MKESVKKIDLTCFAEYDGLDINEFLINNEPGREHYKLLAYLSSLFNDSNIFDIGTHRGSSALALSYNSSNKIYTFDLIDKIQHGEKSIKNKSNIFFSTDNLLDMKEREKWESKILSSPLIFLDIDPHEGKLEYQFYEYLLSKNYKGMLVCDDIYYFKGMRDNFWYLIPTEHKTDITHLGHWSGTGVISFVPQKIVWEGSFQPKNNWTLVTAYFDLTKMKDASTEINKRPVEHYLSQSNATLSIDHNMIVFCDPDMKNRILNIRPKHLHSKTLIITQSFEDFPMSQYRDKIINNRNEKPYCFDNRNTASYYLFCMARYAMLKQAMSEDPFNSTHFAWINICIERMGYSNLVHLEEAFNLNRDKVSTCYIDYVSPSLINNVNEYFKFGRCSMCSGFFTGSKDNMNKFCNLIENKFLEYLNQGYGHADEQLFSPVYFENPELFEWYLGDYQQMITNYAYVYEAPEAPMNNLIRNSFNDKNREICHKACNILLKSINLGKVKLDQNYYSKLMNIMNANE